MYFQTTDRGERWKRRQPDWLTFYSWNNYRPGRVCAVLTIPIWETLPEMFFWSGRTLYWLPFVLFICVFN